MKPADRENGSATVYVLALVLVLGVAATLVSALGLAAVARHRAAAAADGAALAGALALGAGTPACRAARRVAVASGALLRACVVDSATVTVAVEVVTRLPGAPSVLALARAAPRRLDPHQGQRL